MKIKTDVEAFNERIMLGKNVLIRKMTNSTKICSYCGGDMPAGLAVLAICDVHRASGTGKTYWSATAYMHLECVPEMYNEFTAAMGKYKEALAKNKMRMVAKQI